MILSTLYIFGVSDTLMVTNFQKPAKKESKKDLPSKASTSKKKSKDDEDGKKKKQKKKDPNAPKRAMSGFMFFSKLEREVCSILSYWLFGFGFGCVSCGWEYLLVITLLLHSCLASEFGVTITMATK